MLEKYYSIGEFAKITDIPMRTLHFYDRKGVLKPIKIDEQNNYRYYSPFQIVDAELIKTFKLLDVNLDEIIEIQSYSTNELLQFLTKQQEIIEEKEKKIKAAKENLISLKQQFEQQLNLTNFEEVYIKEEKEQTILKMKIGENQNIEESDYVLKNIVEYDKLKHSSSLLGGIFPLVSYSSFEEMKYEWIFLPVPKDMTFSDLPNNVELDVIPAGQYVTIAFAHEPTRYFEMFQKLIQYIEMDKLAVKSSLYEFFYPLNYKLNKALNYDIELKIKISK